MRNSSFLKRDGHNTKRTEKNNNNNNNKKKKKKKKKKHENKEQGKVSLQSSKRLSYINLERLRTRKLREDLRTIIRMSDNLFDIYWAKVLTDHHKNCDNVFVVQYFEMNFGNSNKTQFGINRPHQMESGILHAVCACVNIQNL